MTEPELVKRAQAGDNTAFDVLFNQNRAKVFRLCYRFVDTPDQAEDLTQDAFLKAFTKLKSFRGECKFGVWVYRIAFNLGLMSKRRKKLPTIDLDTFNFEYYFPLKEPSLEFKPDRALLSKALHGLPLDQREVLVQHLILGLSHEDISSKFNITVASSKSRLHRGKLELRKRYLELTQC